MSEIRLTIGTWPDGKKFVLMALVNPRRYRLKKPLLMLKPKEVLVYMGVPR